MALKPYKFKYKTGNSVNTDTVIIQGDQQALTLLLFLVDSDYLVYPSINSPKDLSKYASGTSINSVILRIGGSKGVSKEKLLKILPLLEEIG